MKTFTISAALALLTSLVSAAPATTPHEARQFQAQITFIGAADGSFTQSVPTDGSLFTIRPSSSPASMFLQTSVANLISAANPLSVSKISSQGGATCGFSGIDGSLTVLVGAQTVDVGPPQTQISGSCRAF
ncbi:MAG: hypothetical protein Q9210_001904 [Variospora velana]